MILKDEKDILKLIENDRWMMDIMKTVQELHLPDCWVCAGFIRSKVWDVLHQFSEGTKLPDVDVVYFDPNQISETEEKQLEKKLHLLFPGVPWSVKNEARMHLVNQLDAYTSTKDAISKFPETVTALGVRLDEDDKLQLTAPHGVDDLINMTVKPTPYFSTKEHKPIYMQRIKSKSWHVKWPLVTYL